MRNARVLAVVALAALLVLAGCSAGSDGSPAAANASQDGLGVENGYAYDDALSIDASDGLDEAELEAVVSRMMARVEYVRGLEFERSVPVAILSRDEYREQRGGDGGDAEVEHGEEQFWEAAFVVDEATTVGEARGGVFGATVQGFYNGSHIVIVTDDPTALPSRATLAHELQHALQDQHGLLASRSDARTHDGRLAIGGIVEGDANVVEHAYETRCEGEWSCIPKPDRSGGGGGSFNYGLFVSVFVPYSDGPTLVEDLRERGGWEAVDDALRSPPVSTEQVIHPSAYPNETPASVRIDDRSDDAWDRLQTQGGDGYRWDTIGEATLYAAFWYNDVVPRDHLRSDSTPLSPYDYSHPITAGWGGDRLVPYTNGSAYGYVFASTWDTERDARQFHDGYVKLLESHDAREVRTGTYRIPDSSPYGDAFRVERDGKRVVVVNAPTVADLAGVHAATAAAESTPDSENVWEDVRPVLEVAAVLVVLVVVVGLLSRRFGV
jgi:hypothetical protein